MGHLLRWKWRHFRGNVGKYSLHGAYGIFLHILLGNRSAKLHEATFRYKQCSTVPTKTSTTCPSDRFSSLPIYCQAFHFSLGGLTGHEFMWSNYSDFTGPGPLEGQEGKSPSGKSRLVKYYIWARLVKFLTAIRARTKNMESFLEMDKYIRLSVYKSSSM